MTQKKIEKCPGCRNPHTHCTCNMHLEVRFHFLMSFTDKVEELGTEKDIEFVSKYPMRIRHSFPN